MLVLHIYVKMRLEESPMYVDVDLLCVASSGDRFALDVEEFDRRIC